MKPGRLSDVARHVIYPPAASTAWPSVRDRSRQFGVEFDPWQDGLGRIILAKDDAGRNTCAIGGVVVSIPRQVGKTFLIGAMAFALCTLRPGLRAIWTAHHGTTSDETFEAMLGYARRKKIAPYVKRPLLDAMTIEFRNGSSVQFGARERGFGRGLSAVGFLVFDEAQILTERAVADMVPTTNVVEDALVIYLGTPPKPGDPSEVFSNRRAEALSGVSEGMAYVEFSADPDADPEDRRQWAKANPSFPARTNEAAMLRMKKNLGVDSFRREALGIWDDRVRSELPVIAAADWSPLATDDPPVDGVPGFGVQFSPDGVSVALSVAVVADGRVPHVEVVEHRLLSEGTGWLVDWLVARRDESLGVAIDGRAGAGELVEALKQARFPARRVWRMTADEAVTAVSSFVSAAREGRLSHFGDPVLTESVESAGRRKIGTAGGWGLTSINGGDATPVLSAVNALFGATVKASKRRRTAGGDRRIITL